LIKTARAQYGLYYVVLSAISLQKGLPPLGPDSYISLCYQF
jgi:hypothetical protein